MQIEDQAIILSAQKYGESSAIIAALTENNGLYKGFVKGALGKRSRGIYQAGNIVELTWKSRVENNLGNITCELTKPCASLVMNEPDKLAALCSISVILEDSLSEREPANIIYKLYYDFINYISDDKNFENIWVNLYIKLEVELLSFLGFGMDLSTCAATGASDDLIYISPKTGRAVSAAAGAPYKDKLFCLPQIFINQINNSISRKDTKNSLAICSYFLNKHIFKPYGKNIPVSRMRFEEML